MLLNLNWKMAFMLLFIINVANAGQQTQRAVTTPIPIDELKGYTVYSPIVRQLISSAYSLSLKNLTYLYGSSDPKNNGMDCSGTIYYLLNNAKVNDVPRDASEMFTWAEKEGRLYNVSEQHFNSPQYAHLKPGDLLFWSGTYAVHRYPSITHVMIYLGVNKKGDPLMFGASDGRYYQGKKMWGVSVFDFELPKDNSAAKFVGYSCIPHLTCG